MTVFLGRATLGAESSAADPYITFFELPNLESTRKKPFRADEILLLVVSGSVDTKEEHETTIKQRQGLRLTNAAIKFRRRLASSKTLVSIKARAKSLQSREQTLVQRS